MPLVFQNISHHSAALEERTFKQSVELCLRSTVWTTTKGILPYCTPNWGITNQGMHAIAGQTGLLTHELSSCTKETPTPEQLERELKPRPLNSTSLAQLAPTRKMLGVNMAVLAALAASLG